MKSKIHSLTVTNNFDFPITLWLEPWGRDYTLRAKETFEIEAASADQNFDLNYLLTKKSYIIYAHGNCDYVVVMQNGKPLNCGHNRDLIVCSLISEI
jgi:hypothetical protein